MTAQMMLGVSAVSRELRTISEALAPLAGNEYDQMSDAECQRCAANVKGRLDSLASLLEQADDRPCA